MTTALQNLMLAAIARNEHTNLNGQAPSALDDVGAIWVSGIVSTAEEKGVFASLLNAELITAWDYEKGVKVVELTQEGFDAYMAHRQEPIAA